MKARREGQRDSQSEQKKEERSEERKKRSPARVRDISAGSSRLKRERTGEIGSVSQERKIK